MTLKIPPYTYSPSTEECQAIFVSSCIESVAVSLGVEATAVYQRMQRIGLISDYIIPCYDVLHAESRQNVTQDILKTMEIWEKKKGFAK